MVEIVNMNLTNCTQGVLVAAGVFVLVGVGVLVVRVGARVGRGVRVRVGAKVGAGV